jgi:hypothetical protein
MVTVSLECRYRRYVSNCSIKTQGNGVFRVITGKLIVKLRLAYMQAARHIMFYRVNVFVIQITMQERDYRSVV